MSSIIGVMELENSGYCYLMSLDNPLELEQLENKISLHNIENFKSPLLSEKEAIMKKIQHTLGDRR